MDLTIRKTLIGGDTLNDDYCVIHDGRSVGRIRLAEERSWQGVCRSAIPCACRKSNPNILVMQPAQDWKAKNTPCPLNRAR